MLEGGEVCGKKTIKSRPPTPPGGGMAAAPEGQRGRPMRPPSCVGGVGIRAAIVAAYALAARAANLNRCGVIQAKQGRNNAKRATNAAALLRRWWWWVSVRPSWPRMRSPRGLLTSTAAG